MRFLAIGFLVLLTVLQASFSFSDEAAPTPERCLECHQTIVDLKKFQDSAHGRLGCTACHASARDLENHLAGQTVPVPVDCSSCHQSQAGDHYASVHATASVGCADCHDRIHSRTAGPQEKQAVANQCGQCHATRWYDYSVHGQALAAGNSDAAACQDCHGVHNVEKREAGTKEFQQFQTETCLQCHADREKMARNGVFPLTVAAYEKSFHGKNYRLGYPQRVAECADCHTASGTTHGILPPDDGRSSINETQILGTCGQCHAGIDQDFTTFQVHGTWQAPARYPVLFWTYAAMTGLIIAVFLFFWTHTLLWLFRGAVEKRERENALAEGRLQPVAEGQIHYYRFRPVHIALHLVVIVSFLGLSFTGLPLKFAGMEWADSMMRFYGGPQVAGLVHRVCAVLTFGYFFVALAMSVHFLFLRRDLPAGWRQRLFGPDSLWFNRKDLRDLKNMCKWFVFRGEKPHFERWTYWEKFDFFAVFWGMFAIGGSGLLLWFAEFFGSAIGGWWLNIAAIIHSDEALLATGFIFTVHFFNTHGRPEKFPMDFVIFNGEISKQDFVTERSEQWQRYQAEGKTEQYRVQKSTGVVYDFLLKACGYGWVLGGLFLAFLMIYAFYRG